MRSTTILIFFLQTLWVKLCFGLSSNNSFSSHLRMTYDEILGGPRETYSDPNSCAQVTLWKNDVAYYQAISYCLANRIRLPKVENDIDKEVVRKILCKYRDLDAVWVFNSHPDAKGNCYWANRKADGSCGLQIQFDFCNHEVEKYFVVTFDDVSSINVGACPALDLRKVSNS